LIGRSFYCIFIAAKRSSLLASQVAFDGVFGYIFQTFSVES